MKINRLLMLTILIPIGLLAGIIALYTSQILVGTVSAKTQATLENQTFRYAEIHGRELKLIEKNVKHLKRYIEETLDWNAFRYDLSYRESYDTALQSYLTAILQPSGARGSLKITFVPQLISAVLISGLEDYDGNGTLEPAAPLSITYFTTATTDPEKDWFFKPIASGQAAWTGPTERTEGIDGQYYLSYSQPVFLYGQLIGIASADLDLSTITDPLKAARFHRFGYAFLTNENLEILYHPEYSQGQFLEDIDSGKFAALSNQLQTYDNGILELGKFSGKTQVISFKRLPNQWILYLTADKGEVLSSSSALINLILGLVILSILLALLLSHLSGRMIARPLTQLIDVLHRDSGALAEEPFPKDSRLLTRRDEIGKLSRTIHALQQSRMKAVQDIIHYNDNLNIMVEARNQNLIEMNRKLTESRQTLEAQQNRLREDNNALEDTIIEMMRMQKLLIDSEKIASFGYMISGIADEIVMPLEESQNRVSQMRHLLEPLEVKPSGVSAIETESLSALSAHNRQLIKQLYYSKDIVDYIKDISNSRAHHKRLPIIVREALLQSTAAAINLEDDPKTSLNLNCPPELSIEADPGLLNHILFSILITILGERKTDSACAIAIKVEADETDLRINLYDAAQLHAELAGENQESAARAEETRHLRMGFNMINLLMGEFFKGEFKILDGGPLKGHRYLLHFKNVF